MNSSSLAIRRTRVAGWCGAAAILPLPRLAYAATGLHQVVSEADAGVLARFDGLWTIGVFAALLGGLLLIARASAVRGGGQPTIAVGGALLGFFGAAAMLFSFLPGIAISRNADLWLLSAPLALMLVFLLMLVGALGRCAPNAWLPRRPGRALSAALWLALLTLFVGVPIACAWAMVWNRGAAPTPGSWPGIGNLFASRYWSLGCLSGSGACGSAVNSIVLGVAVAALAGLLGSALAFYVHRAASGSALRKWVAIVVCLPMITPPFLVGLGLAQIFGQSGVASVALEASFGMARSRWFFGAYGVMMAQVLVFFPIVYFLVLNALDTLGRTQIESAKLLGASDFDVLRTVSLPAVRDSLAVALLVVFVEALSDVGNPLIIGGKLRMLSTELFYSSSMELSAGEMTGVPALLLTAIALLMTALKERFTARRFGGVAPVLAGAEHERAGVELPPALRWLLGIVLAATVAILASVYAVIGVGAFCDGGVVAGSLTLENFARGFGFSFSDGDLLLTGSAWESLIASFSCAFLVAPVGGVIGMAMVWVVQRGAIQCPRLVESVSTYLLSVPSVVVGAGFLLVFGYVGLSNQGAWLLILLAMLIRNLAVCMRFGGVALLRVDRAQSEISGLLGAGSLTTFFRVIAPLLRSTFVVCVAYGFVRSLTMLGSVLLLSSADNQVATTYMIDRIGIGEYGVGMAYGVVLVGCIGAVLGAGWLFFSIRKGAAGLAMAIGDLKAAVVLVQKSARHQRPGY